MVSKGFKIFLSFKRVSSSNELVSSTLYFRFSSKTIWIVWFTLWNETNGNDDCPFGVLELKWGPYYEDQWFAKAVTGTVWLYLLVAICLLYFEY